MIRIHNLTVPVLPEEDRRKALEKKISRLFGGKLPPYRLVRRSVDARKKDAICYIYTVDVTLGPEKAEQAWLKHHNQAGAEAVKPEEYRLPSCGEESLTSRPLVVGAGPAGLFAALSLAEAGFCPLVIEQGAPVEERTADVKAFWQGGPLKPLSNVQFGEGGAGTFSDGKLNTGIRDPGGRISHVLEVFCEAGAPEEILYDAKPHIGTDILVHVVRNIREKIISLGGTFLFHTRLTDISAENGKLAAAELEDSASGMKRFVRTDILILAPGHSSRETFPMLLGRGVDMTAKPFAMGLRIQHPQKLINAIQYGDEAPADLPAADYKLTAKTAAGRGVYSFCMCPGGQVVNASSEAGRLCINGMSESARAGRNANAALIVQVGPEDLPSDDVLAGMTFQRQLEEAAFLAAGGLIPAQRWEDFTLGKKTEEAGSVEPDFCGGWAFAELGRVIPPFMKEALLEAMPQFDRKMKGFALPDAILAGVEARTSSPVRILRSEAGESSIGGLYPCGEGAGYAGGITSAAVDGLRIAEAVIKRFCPADPSVKGEENHG